MITKGKGSESDKYVCLNEVWLRDKFGKPLLPNILILLKDCIRPCISYSANLLAVDPARKMMEPGNEYRMESFDNGEVKWSVTVN